MYGLIFDVDGLIADTEGANARATARVFAEHFDLPGVTREDFEKGIGRGAEAYVRAGARANGRELTEEEVEKATRLRQEYFLRLLREEPLDPLPGVMELMEAALNEPEIYRLAVATSSTREKSGAVLDSTGVPLEEMEYVCGDDVSKKKPDPELFQIAAHRLDLPPDRCVVFEDAPDGVAAAHAAGAACVAVTNSVAREKLQDADRIVDSLGEIDLKQVRRLIDNNGASVDAFLPL